MGKGAGCIQSSCYFSSAKKKAGYKGESDQSFWMMSYDFKPYKKEDYKPDSLDLRKRRKYKNKLIIILYIIVVILFMLMNSFLSHILILISN